MKTKLRRIVILAIVVLTCFTIPFAIKLVINSHPSNVKNLINSDFLTSVNTIDIQLKNTNSILLKKDNHWYINVNNETYPADSERITRILAGIATITDEEIVSTNKDRHIVLGIEKQRIILKNNTEVKTIYIGESAGIDKYYVRLNDEDLVVIASGMSEVFFPEDYRDLKPKLIIDENNPQKINLNWEENKILLMKKKDTWMVNNINAKKDRIDFFLNDIKTLKATDMYKSLNDKTDQNEPIISIVFTQNNKETVAEFRQDDTENYILKVSGNQYMYRIPAVYVNALKKTVSDFAN